MLRTKRSVDILNLCLIANLLYLTGNTGGFYQQTKFADGPAPMIFVANPPKPRSISRRLFITCVNTTPSLFRKLKLTKGIPSISYNLKYGGGANIDRKAFAAIDRRN